MNRPPRGVRLLAAGMLLAATSLAAGEESTQATPGIAPFGPLPMRSMDSLSLLFYQATAERASTLPRGEWEISTNLLYGTLASSDHKDDFTVLRDEEVLRWEIRARWGIRDDLEFALVLPFHYFTSGFLDEFIDDFHDFTGLGPTDRPFNRFADRIFFRGEPVLDLPENTVALADIPVALKYSWLRDGRDPLGVSLRAGIEFPTGSESRSFGNGGLDGGFGAVLEKTVGEFTFYLAADASLQQAPRSFRKAGVSVEPIVATASLAGEWRALEWLALSVQLDYGMPLILDGDVPQLERHRLLGTLGFAAQLSENVAARIGFSEDLFLSGPVPDLTFLFGLVVRL